MSDAITAKLNDECNCCQFCISWTWEAICTNLKSPHYGRRAHGVDCCCDHFEDYEKKEES